MPFSLRSGLHWCLCGERVILLDLSCDRYLGLNPSLQKSFLSVVSGELEDRDCNRLQQLVDHGLLVEEEWTIAGNRELPIGLSTSDFLNEARPKARVLDLLDAILSQLRWSIRLRFRPLMAIAAQIERRSNKECRRPAGADQRLAQLLAAFEASALVLPAADRCLVRALALQDLCVRSAIHPQLVFGVRVNPFRAHCWLELEGEVLIGDYEQVRLFTPIAALG